MSSSNTQSDQCPNCLNPVIKTQAYCPSCGQKNGSKKIAVFDFLKEFFSSVFNIDSRFFITLRHLIAPGKLTRFYFEGKRKSYLHPLKLFFFSLVIFFGVLSTTNVNYDNSLSTKDFLYELKVTSKQKNETIAKLDTSINWESITPSSAKDTIIATVEKSFQSNSNKSYPCQLWSKDSSKMITRDVAFEDISQMDEDELFAKHKVNGLFNKIAFRQQMRAVKDLEGLFIYFYANLIWMTFALLILTSGLMYILYLRKKRFYVEHLVLLFHTHAFVLLTMSIYVLLAEWISYVWGIGFFFIHCVYIYFSIKKYYGQSHIKTIAKSFLLILGYFFFIAILACLTLAISFLVY